MPPTFSVRTNRIMSSGSAEEINVGRKGREQNRILMQPVLLKEEDDTTYVDAPIDKLGCGGRWLRHALLNCILAGTPVLLGLQRRRSPLLNKMMLTMSFLGTEDFYTPLILLIGWVIDVRLGCIVALLMAAGFYLASFFKCCLCLPRPPKPPIEPLEIAKDWALPSHHSILGVSLPLYMFFYAYINYDMTTMQTTALFSVISVWSFLVMFSRMYLGVHSPADIVFGGIIGCLLLVTFLHVDGFIDRACTTTGPILVVQMLAYCIILLAIHPQTRPQTLSFADTVCICGVVLGILLGRTRTTNPPATAFLALLEQKQFLDQQQDPAVSIGLFMLLAIALARLIIGFPVVLLTRVVVKNSVKWLLHTLGRACSFPVYSFSDHVKTAPMMDKHYSQAYRLPPIYEKQPMNDSTDSECSSNSQSSSLESTESLPHDLDIPIKLVTYAAMGWMALEGAPLLFQLLSLNLL